MSAAPPTRLSFGTAGSLAWLGLVWLAILWWTVASPRPGLLVAAIVSVLGPGILWWRQRQYSPAWLWPATIAFFMTTSLAALSVTSSLVWQYGLITVSAAFVGLELDHQPRLDRLPQSRRLTMLIVALGLFFGWLTLLSFGVGIFLPLAWGWLVVGGAVVTVVAAIIAWVAAGVPWTTFRKIVPLVSLLGGLFMVGTWWLPTPVHVGSIVAATALTLWFQTCRHVWLGTWESGRGRRYLLTAGSLIGLVLGTARWI
ncbi:MAG: hypothetical protein HYY50_02320 [Candidatus Kerfeldbacteria bacterium]|nr:hypothetical protein [Candidatus Kerfeldbacteria bacterium]